MLYYNGLYSMLTFYLNVIESHLLLLKTKTQDFFNINPNLVLRMALYYKGLLLRKIIKFKKCVYDKPDRNGDLSEINSCQSLVNSGQPLYATILARAVLETFF